jgi:transcriptional regulator with XRE-family HTH domain
MTLTELADRIGLTLANLSILKTGKARAIRFSTLEAICEALSCPTSSAGSSREASQRSLGCSSWHRASSLVRFSLTGSPSAATNASLALPSA